MNLFHWNLDNSKLTGAGDEGRRSKMKFRMKTEVSSLIFITLNSGSSPTCSDRHPRQSDHQRRTQETLLELQESWLEGAESICEEEYQQWKDQTKQYRSSRGPCRQSDTERHGKIHPLKSWEHPVHLSTMVRLWLLPEYARKPKRRNNQRRIPYTQKCSRITMFAKWPN